jgi:hypothetical protein
MLPKVLQMTAVLLTCFISFSNGQSPSKKLVTTALHRHSLIKNDTAYLFYAIHPSKKVKLSSTKIYYWYTKDTILATEGGFDGWVLNGSYKIFYPNKNLKEEGMFTNGLKTRRWQTWFPDGTLKTITTWKNGERSGFFEEQDSTGSLLNEGHYKKNKINGIMTEFNSDGKKKKVKYKHGIPIEKKKKKKKSST